MPKLRLAGVIRESIVDGPGIRMTVFTQGCPHKCKGCHNEQTWDFSGGYDSSTERILEEAKKDPILRGLTFSGGEPLLQTDFLIELFSLAKSHDIHTCIDTSGIVFNSESTEKLDRLLALTDLVMLDIKHIDPARHKELTGYDNENILAFARYLDRKNVPLWIRHIVVEGYTDSADELIRLGEFIGTLKSLKALDVLPYHTMGVGKYKELGIPYKLEGVPALPLSEAVTAKQHILNGIKKVRNARNNT